LEVGGKGKGSRQIKAESSRLKAEREEKLKTIGSWLVKN
jgi:hypothetical protein